MDELEYIIAIAAEHGMVVVESSLTAYKLYAKRGCSPVSFHEYVTDGGGVLCYHIMEKPLNKQ